MGKFKGNEEIFYISWAHGKSSAFLLSKKRFVSRLSTLACKDHVDADLVVVQPVKQGNLVPGVGLSTGVTLIINPAPFNTGKILVVIDI